MPKMPFVPRQCRSDRTTLPPQLNEDEQLQYQVLEQEVGGFFGRLARYQGQTALAGSCTAQPDIFYKRLWPSWTLGNGPSSQASGCRYISFAKFHKLFPNQHDPELPRTPVTQYKAYVFDPKPVHEQRTWDKPDASGTEIYTWTVYDDPSYQPQKRHLMALREMYMLLCRAGCLELDTPETGDDATMAG